MTPKTRPRQARKGRGRRGRQQNGGVDLVPAAVAPPLSRAKEANLVLTASELWYACGAIPTTPMVKVFSPGNSGLARLDGIAAIFDEYRILKCKLIYKPYVGTTATGMMALAVDYDTVRYPETAAAMVPIQPQIRLPIWKGGEVVVDPGRANKQKWLRTANATTIETGAFCSAGYWTGSASAGEVWCEYSIHFTNPRSTYAPVSSFAFKGGDMVVGSNIEKEVGTGVAANTNAPLTGATLYPWFVQPGTFEVLLSGNIAVDQALATAIDNWWTALGWQHDIMYTAGAIFAFVTATGAAPLLASQAGINYPTGLPSMTRMLTPALQVLDINNIFITVRRILGGDYCGALMGARHRREQRDALDAELSKPYSPEGIDDDMVSVSSMRSMKRK